MGEICEGYVRDEVRDEPLKTPLNKGFLLKNVRDDGKIRKSVSRWIINLKSANKRLQSQINSLSLHTFRHINCMILKVAKKI